MINIQSVLVSLPILVENLGPSRSFAVYFSAVAVRLVCSESQDQFWEVLSPAQQKNISVLTSFSLFEHFRISLDLIFTRAFLRPKT